MGRMMIVVNKALEDRVLKLATQLRTTPNPFVNSCVSSCLDVMEGGDRTATPQVIDMYFRLTDAGEGRLSRAMTRAAYRLMPDLPELEERFRTLLLEWIYQHFEQHGQMPSETQLKAKREELARGNVQLHKELKGKRKSQRGKTS